jgi:hypothetical protein
MFEPHLINHANDHTHNEHSYGEGDSLLDELDKIAPIKSFDAFPKVRPAVSAVVMRKGVWV